MYIRLHRPLKKRPPQRHFVRDALPDIKAEPDEAYRKRLEKRYWQARQLWLQLDRWQKRTFPWEYFYYHVKSWDILLSEWPELHWHWAPDAVANPAFKAVRVPIPKFDYDAHPEYNWIRERAKRE